MEARLVGGSRAMVDDHAAIEHGFAQPSPAHGRVHGARHDHRSLHWRLRLLRRRRFSVVKAAAAKRHRSEPPLPLERPKSWTTKAIKAKFADKF